MGHCGSKQHYSTSSQRLMIDPSSMGMKPTMFKGTKRRAAAVEVVSGATVTIGDAVHESRLITCCDGEVNESHSSTCTTTQSTQSSSNDDDHSIMYSPKNADIAVDKNSSRKNQFHRKKYNSSSSPSPPRSRLLNKYNNKLTNTSFNQKYEILSQVKLGHGVSGQVHQCIHRTTSQPCAVKTISKLHDIRLRRDSRIKREISILRHVRGGHPNIINILDVYETNREVRIVTELCRGGELFERIVKKAKLSKNRMLHANNNNSNDDDDDGYQASNIMPVCFSEKDTARIIHSLLDAVRYLHKNGIVHRDLKPENILFAEKDDDESPIKLIDFGLAIRHTPSCKPLSSTVGTAYYMAPEVLLGSYDRSCDLWSVGVLTFIMLSGRPPFNGATDSAIFKNIRRGQYHMEKSMFWNTCISEHGRDFIRCLLDKDTKRRWTADMALEHEWIRMHCGSRR